MSEKSSVQSSGSMVAKVTVLLSVKTVMTFSFTILPSKVMDTAIWKKVSRSSSP